MRSKHLLLPALFACLAACRDTGMTTPEVPEMPQPPVQDSLLKLPWAVLSGRIAVERDNTSATTLIDADNRRVRDMGSLHAYAIGFDLSRDGDKLALGYALGTPGGAIVGINVVGTTAGSAILDFRPGNGDFQGSAPRWRYDGKLSYWDSGHLFVDGVAVGDFRPPDSGGYSWSRDDAEILLSYWNDTTHTQTAYGLRVSDGKLRTIIAGAPSSYWMSPTAGARGDSIIVKNATMGQAGDGIGELWIMSSSGSGRRLITPVPVGAFDISPDGSRIVAVGSGRVCPSCPPPLDPGIYLINIDDGTIDKLMDLAAFNVRWGR